MRVLALLVVAALATASFGQNVNPDEVPQTARMTTVDGDVNFELPPGKTLVVSRYRREEITEATLESEISAILSGAQATTSTLEELTSNIEPLATTAAVNTLEEQVSALRVATQQGVNTHEIDGLSNLVEFIVSDAEAASSLAEVGVDAFPSIESTIQETNSLATEIFTSRLGQINIKNDVYGTLNNGLVNQNYELLSVASQLSTGVVEALSTIASFEADIQALEGQINTLNQAYDFVEHFSGNSVGNSTKPVMRWAQWSTYAQSGSWYMGNSASYFAGVSPSRWSDNGLAAETSPDPVVLRSLFNKKIWCGFSCAPHSQEWYYYSSTNTMLGGVVMRVRNTEMTAVEWPLSFFYSSSGSYSEYASISLNRNNVWSRNDNCGACNAEVTLTLPANRISTVIMVVTSSNGSGTRTMHMAFVDDCLLLPDGLEWVDDLDTITQL